MGGNIYSHVVLISGSLQFREYHRFFSRIQILAYVWCLRADTFSWCFTTLKQPLFVLSERLHGIVYVLHTKYNCVGRQRQNHYKWENSSPTVCAFANIIYTIKIIHLRRIEPSAPFRGLWRKKNERDRGWLIKDMGRIYMSLRGNYN